MRSASVGKLTFTWADSDDAVFKLGGISAALSLFAEANGADFVGFGVFSADEAKLSHDVEGVILAPDEAGVKGSIEGVETGGVLRDGGKHGGFGQGEVDGVAPEIGAGTRLDAVAAATEW